MLDKSIPRFLEDGTFLGYIGSLVDIHDYILAEEKIRFQAGLIENASDIIISTDEHFNVITWNKKAEEIYNTLTKAGVEVLFDDREESAGAKFADSDLIGIPMRVVVSDKSLEKGGVEIKERKSEASEIISIEQLYKTYTPNCE